MSNTIDGIYYDVVVLDEIKTREEAISHISNYLEKKGYVNKQYVDATIKREYTFPTGLSTKPIGIAVPHSERENVIKPAVIMGICKKPIEFYKMEDSESKMEVGVIFLLALQGENSHLNYLKNIVNYCKYEENLKKLYYAESTDEAYKIFISQILKFENNLD